MRHTLNRLATGCCAITVAIATLFSIMLNGPVQAGDESGSDASATEPKADKAMVVPYETRAVPSHQVELRDDRVYFTKKLEKKGDTYILHTLEGEVLEIEASDIARIVEYKSE